MISREVGEWQEDVASVLRGIEPDQQVVEIRFEDGETERVTINDQDRDRWSDHFGETHDILTTNTHRMDPDPSTEPGVDGIETRELSCDSCGVGSDPVEASGAYYENMDYKYTDKRTVTAIRELPSSEVSN